MSLNLQKQVHLSNVAIILFLLHFLLKKSFLVFFQIYISICIFQIIQLNCPFQRKFVFEYVHKKIIQLLNFRFKESLYTNTYIKKIISAIPILCLLRNAIFKFLLFLRLHIYLLKLNKKRMLEPKLWEICFFILYYILNEIRSFCLKEIRTFVNLKKLQNIYAPIFILI